jgi:hypothetical protein
LLFLPLRRDSSFLFNGAVTNDRDFNIISSDYSSKPFTLPKGEWLHFRLQYFSGAEPLIEVLK